MNCQAWRSERRVRPLEQILHDLPDAGGVVTVLEFDARFTPDDVRRDLEGLQTMRTLGNNMAHLLKSLSQGGVPLPQQEPRVSTNFIS